MRCQHRKCVASVIPGARYCSGHIESYSPWPFLVGWVLGLATGFFGTGLYVVLFR